MDSSEKIIFFNSFGTVSDKRVIINYKKGSVDIPLKQISSVSYERKRNIPLSIFYLVLGIGIFIGIFQMGENILFPMLFFFLYSVLIGVTYYIGNHQIKFSSSDKDINPIKVEMAKTKEGREFSNSIRHQLVSI